MRETGDAPTPEVAAAEESETAAAATRTRGDLPRWIVPALVVVALLIAVVNIAMFDGSAGGWVVLAAMIALTVGASLALNPRRGSLPGGTAER